jgi:hypothetical protein
MMLVGLQRSFCQSVAPQPERQKFKEHCEPLVMGFANGRKAIDIGLAGQMLTPTCINTCAWLCDIATGSSTQAKNTSPYTSCNPEEPSASLRCLSTPPTNCHSLVLLEHQRTRAPHVSLHNSPILLALMLSLSLQFCQRPSVILHAWTATLFFRTTHETSAQEYKRCQCQLHTHTQCTQQLPQPGIFPNGRRAAADSSTEEPGHRENTHPPGPSMTVPLASHRLRPPPSATPAALAADASLK